jgi:hypothetical protein
MSLLRILRNLAVLVILTVGVLTLSPRPMAAQSSCKPLGDWCTSSAQCCNRWCGVRRQCCLPLHNMACKKSTDCCSGVCLPRGGYGSCL